MTSKTGPLCLRRRSLKGTPHCCSNEFKSRTKALTAPVVEVELQQEGDELKCTAKDVYPKPFLSWSPSTQQDDASDLYQTESGLYNISSVRLSHNTVNTCNVSTAFSWKTATFKPLTGFFVSFVWISLGVLALAVVVGVIVWWLCRENQNTPTTRASDNNSEENDSLRPLQNGLHNGDVFQESRV